VQIGSEPITYPKHNTVVFSSEAGQHGVRITRPADSTEDTRFILVAGEPFDQPIVQYGPFVMNTERQTREAIMDFRMGRNGFERAPGWESKFGKEFKEAR
jgi:redox-sensitive bicupin YhaK (pirin superfamily)